MNFLLKKRPSSLTTWYIVASPMEKDLYLQEITGSQSLTHIRIEAQDQQLIMLRWTYPQAVTVENDLDPWRINTKEPLQARDNLLLSDTVTAIRSSTLLQAQLTIRLFTIALRSPFSEP